MTKPTAESGQVGFLISRNAQGIRINNMKKWQIITMVVLASVATTLVTQKTTRLTKSTAATNARESVYERIMRTGVIRAAYITYPPAVMKDSATGKLTGTFVETLEEVAKNLGVKLEWTEEVGWGAQIEGLKTDRYDIIGSPVWANPNRGKLTTMSIPVYYSGIGVWVRADDNRFEGDLSKINAPDVRIGTIDGETADLIARTSFPSAQRISSPQLTDISEKFLQLQTSKADVVFAEPFFGFEFLKNNNGTVKNIAAAKPIQVLGNCYMFKENEFQMKGMMDVAIQGLLNSGFVDRVLKKFEPAPGTFYRVADPYKPYSDSR
jgi:ABC-type amino acid transport substrate-binding protein